jgi:hypothetical protein
MIQMQTNLDVADNSGARKLQMILPLGGSTGLRAGLGDVITASVKEAAPDGIVKDHEVVKAVVVSRLTLKSYGLKCWMLKSKQERHTYCTKMHLIKSPIKRILVPSSHQISVRK